MLGIANAVVVPESALNRYEVALLLLLVLLQNVLKWLHHPVPKYVMLWHPSVSSHDCLHCSRLEPFPGELCMYTSPAFVSHAVLEPTSCHVGVTSVEVHECHSVVQIGS